MRWSWLKLFAYFKPSWRSLECPHCGYVIRARSGMHITEAVGRHMRMAHTTEHERNIRRAKFLMGVR